MSSSLLPLDPRPQVFLSQASVTIEGIKFVVDCGFVKVIVSFFRHMAPWANILLLKDPNIQSDNHTRFAVNSADVSRLRHSACRQSRSNLTRNMLPSLPTHRFPVSSPHNLPRNYPYGYDYPFTSAEIFGHRRPDEV